jgi:hypothetical protein
MTIGSENFGNGAAKTEDRFAGQVGGYRPRSLRDGGPSPLSAESGDELSPRNGASSSIDRVTTPLDIANPIASTLTAPKLAEPTLVGIPEPPTFAADAWLDAAGGSVVDHPLLRGLLLELPPKGASLHPKWLDRWFEAARSILELLYSFEAANRP